MFPISKYVMPDAAAQDEILASEDASTYSSDILDGLLIAKEVELSAILLTTPASISAASTFTEKALETKAKAKNVLFIFITNILLSMLNYSLKYLRESILRYEVNISKFIKAEKHFYLNCYFMIVERISTTP